MKLLMSIVYVAVIGILAHYIGESLPRSLFSEYNFPYRTYKWENDGKVYNRLNIKKWKTHLPDMSRIMRDMLPKKVSFDATSSSINALIKETCVAECVHYWLCIFSVGIYLIWKNYIGVILAFVFVVCNLPFIMIQRHNRPHLIKLKNKLLKREEREFCAC